MSRLDRYYIPPQIPAKPPASRPYTVAAPPMYAHHNRFPPGMNNYGPPPLPIKGKKRLVVERNQMMVDYEEPHNITSALCLPELSSPRMALQKILFLHECKKHREVANFMKRLNYPMFRSILHQLPEDIFISSMPYSLPILEALYSKMLMASGKPDHLLLSGAGSLRPESVVWQLVKFFASQEDEALGQMRWEFCGPFISSCKKLLAILLSAQPRARRILAERKNALMKAIEGLGQHGLIGDSDGGLVYLHVALRSEFEKVRKSYEEAIAKIEELSLVSGNGSQKGHHHGSQMVAPIAQSHQRQLSIKSSEVQERLIKNKTLLNVIEPTLENTSLEVLLGILQQRIELDKECLFQFTQVKKESHLDKLDQSVAPILMRYQRGCQQVLDLMREVSESKEDDEDNGSDISGYHSDNESAVMTSGNSPFVSKEARFSFLSRSVRLGSKHNVRSSILASSLCLASLSHHGGSIRSQSINGSIVARSDLGTFSEQRKKSYESRSARLAIHSSSGVSSGSSSSDSAEDKIGPQSPALSSSSSQCTIKPNSINGRAAEPLGIFPAAAAAAASNKQSRILPQNHGAFHVSFNGSEKNYVENGSFTTMNGSEPIYQGIIDGENNVTRKEAEIASLMSEMAKLKTDLALAQRSVSTLRQNELMLKERLADQRHRILTMEKKASIEKFNNSNNSNGMKSSRILDERPAHLVRKYGELYSQLRLETLDALDQLPQLVSSDELKIKLLFSVVVLAFRSVTSSKSAKEEQIRRILQLPLQSQSNNELTTEEVDEEDHKTTNSSAAKELENAINVYLRRATETFDLSKNVEEVCSQIWATLYDYPCLKTCEGIIKYVKECVRVAWGLVNQAPAYVIEYEARQFRSDLHVRYHNSDPGSAIIKTYLWPALLEGQNGPCVQKAVVVT